MISAKVIADSWYWPDHRLTTLECTFHRFILPEVNTHRMFSRNAASSRAIPVAKQIERVKADPALPIFWGKNQAGMSAYEELELGEYDKNNCYWINSPRYDAREEWELASRDAIGSTERLMKIGLHKQLASRLLEPFMWTTMIISATEWDNFFSLRRPPGGVMDPQFPAQPEMQQLAIEMYKAINNSDPMQLGKGEWHLPYLNPEDYNLTIDKKLAISAARCARVSYLTHDGRRDIEKDLELAQKLSENRHMSPFEHQGLVVGDNNFHANFRGYRQYRWFVEEAIRRVTTFDSQDT